MIPFLFWGWAYWYFQKEKKYIYPKFHYADLVMKNAPDTFPLLVGGHSRLQKGIDLGTFKNAIKVGTPGESYIESYYKLKYILKIEKKYPKTLLLPFEMGTFKPNDFRRSFYWKDYMDFVEVGHHKDAIFFYWKEYIMACIIPFRQHFSNKLISIFKQDCLSNDAPKKADHSKQSFASYTHLQGQKMIQNDIDLLSTIGMMDKTSLIYVQKILSLCKEYKIKLYFIKCPLTSEYQAALDSLARLQNYNEQALVNLIDSFENANIIDLQKEFVAKDQYFSDHHHLNKIGSKIFSDLLLKRILN